MIFGLFALVVIFGIVGAVAFLRSGSGSLGQEESDAREFTITEES